MDRAQAVDQPADRCRERLVGGEHAGEARVAAEGRELDGAQDGAERRLGDERRVGVPLVRALALRRALIEHDDLRMLRMPRAEGVGEELAEAAREGDLLRERDRLLAKEEDAVAVQRVLERVHGLARQCLPKIDASDLRADALRDGSNLELRHVPSGSGGSERDRARARVNGLARDLTTRG